MAGFIFGKRLWISLLEVLLIVFFSQIPIAVKIIFDLSRLTDDHLVLTSFKSIVLQSYTLSDVFIFTTGVVGSAMAFFFINANLFKRSPRLVWYCVIIPLLIMFFTAPIFVSDRIDNVPPNNFISQYSVIMLAAILINWVVIVYQKNLDSQSFGDPDKARQAKMNDLINVMLSKDLSND